MLLELIFLNVFTSDRVLHFPLLLLYWKWAGEARSMQKHSNVQKQYIIKNVYKP